MSATTVPMTTAAMTTVPITTVPASGTGGSCSIAIPDYTTLRQQNIDKINSYYDQLLNSYTSSYNDYATQSKGSKNDQVYANKVLLPKYTNLNSQLINLSQTMINNINQDMDLISAQKDELLAKNRKIHTIMNNITMLKDKDSEMTVLTGSRTDSLSSSNQGLEDINFSTYLYIGVDILLVLCILGLVIYIVYSSFSNKRNNNNNNIYRNIAVATP